jgi:AbrB family looped-hinge helix DNA binding protein
MTLHNLDFRLCSTVTLWPKGQIVIPKDVRDTMGIKQWDNLVLFLKAWKFVLLLKGDDLEELTDFIEKQIKAFKDARK